MLDVDRTSATTTLRQDLMTVLVGTWLMFGLFLDGYAHANILSGTESFFTPWHAVFYSGFAATAGWILYLVARGVRSGIPAAKAIPRGYGWATIGIVIFAVGGIGDGAWHTLFGVETGMDALFSPTHLLLFAGLFLIITAPLKAAWARPDDGTIRWGRFFPAWLSITLASALMGFLRHLPVDAPQRVDGPLALRPGDRRRVHDGGVGNGLHAGHHPDAGGSHPARCVTWAGCSTPA